LRNKKVWLPDQVELQLVGDVVQVADPETHIGILIVAADGVVPLHPVGIVIEGGDAHGRMIVDRQVEYALGDPFAIFRTGRAVIGVIDMQSTGSITDLWRLGDHVDDAGRGRLAKQHALRAAQHFHAFHVEQVGDVDITLRHAVDHDADRGFGGRCKRLRGDAADARAAAGGAIDKGDGWGDAIQVAHGGNLLAFKLGGAMGTSCSFCSRFWAVTTTTVASSLEGLGASCEKAAVLMANRLPVAIKARILLRRVIIVLPCDASAHVWDSDSVSLCEDGIVRAVLFWLSQARGGGQLPQIQSFNAIHHAGLCLRHVRDRVGYSGKENTVSANIIQKTGG